MLANTLIVRASEVYCNMIRTVVLIATNRRSVSSGDEDRVQYISTSTPQVPYNYVNQLSDLAVDFLSKHVHLIIA